MGESFGNYRIGNDEEIFPWITSSNIACGFHGGDPWVMEKTIKNAIENGVRIGAHPGYRDLQGFGRRRIKVPPSELRSSLRYQISALKGMVESAGGKVEYVKPHGALYNTACDDESEINVIIDSIQSLDPTLKLMGLAGSLMESAAEAAGVGFISEAFADRRYEPNGKLMSRSLEGSVIEDPEEASEQVLKMILDNEVTAFDGTAIPISATSICIHGDNPAAVGILRAIDEKLSNHNISKQA